VPVMTCEDMFSQLGDLVGSCQANPTLRSIVVQITDQCPECEPDHLDIQALTWAKVSSVQLAGVHVLTRCAQGLGRISHDGGCQWNVTG